LERCSHDDDHRAVLEKRERALLRKHAAGWLTELTAAQVLADRDPADKRRPVWQFRRGFLHAVTVVAQRFPTVAETLFRLAPTVRSVYLRHGSGSVDGLIRTPQLARVTELDLSRMCTCGRCPILNELRSLFASPLVGGVTSLTLIGDRIDPETTAALVSSPHLTKLQSLDLSGNPLGLGGVRVLAAARGFGELRELNLSENGISASGGQVLARAAWLKGLRVLTLSRNNLTDTSGRALLNAEWGDELRRLDVKTNELSESMLRQLRAKFGAQLSH
jgi:Ran GTPase-activating protein (RanGAP) involved in mRNA processing and transport